MKSVSFIISALALVASIYFFTVDFRLSSESNYLIYMGMLLTLIFISILGIVVSLPLAKIGRPKTRSFSYNSYSRERIRNKTFDSQFGMS
ncbi:hypothetical protein [Flavobacterium sp.]|uniref:hypothetical protein n=1 Tax=Flavobacterium sp. TaxID=239 RepID=UPI0011FD56F4|nr:hypothetical protein [Flavobacterium sp.]RZJ71820.1 MAG: hypothetical protein EOO49_09140 [Flavobacterium sp.]